MEGKDSKEEILDSVKKMAAELIKPTEAAAIALSLLCRNSFPSGMTTP